MTDDDLRARAHDLDVTVWVGKAGIEPVVDELSNQLDDTDLVKVKFHDAALGGTDVETAAAELAEGAGAEVFRTRGKTAVVRR